VSLFGISPGGEIIAGATNPDTVFYSWLFEAFGGMRCQYVQGPPTNGHRWQLLKATGQVGFGAGARPSVGDFSGGGTIPKIPSGAHYPRQSGLCKCGRAGTTPRALRARRSSTSMERARR
jgi:hypothetical protein